MHVILSRSGHSHGRAQSCPRFAVPRHVVPSRPVLLGSRLGHLHNLRGDHRADGDNLGLVRLHDDHLASAPAAEQPGERARDEEGEEEEDDVPELVGNFDDPSNK